MKKHSRPESAMRGLRPFKKGDDPRRNKNGARCKEAAIFGEMFVNALAKGGDPKDLAKVLWKYAKAGRPWAIEMILDRLVGKVEQPVTGLFKFEFGENGNGGSH